MKFLKELWDIDISTINDGDLFSVDRLYEESNIINMSYRWSANHSKKNADGFEVIDTSVEIYKQGINRKDTDIGCFLLQSFDLEQYDFTYPTVDNSSYESVPTYDQPTIPDYSSVSSDFELNLPGVNVEHITFQSTNYNNIFGKCIGSPFSEPPVDDSIAANDDNCLSCKDYGDVTVCDFFGDGNGIALFKFDNNCTSVGCHNPFSWSPLTDVEYVTGVLDEAMRLTGDSNEPTVNINPFSLAEGGTISYWTNVVDTGGLSSGDDIFLSKVTVGTETKIAAKINGSCYFIVDNLSDKYHHIVITYNPNPAGVLKYYIDGELTKTINETLNETNELKYKYGISSCSPIDQLRLFKKPINAFKVYCLFLEIAKSLVGG